VTEISLEDELVAVDHLFSVLRDTGWRLAVKSDLDVGQVLVIEADESGFGEVARHATVDGLLRILVERTLRGEIV
jgi:hypothetical protein